MERIYKTMRNTGAASIAVGIVVASVGLAGRHHRHYKRRSAP